MGEVFLAEDTKQHNRKVALKVLPKELLNVRKATASFQTGSARGSNDQSPKHPNNLRNRRLDRYQLHSNEYIEGETLRHRSARTIEPG
jgi:serine/threonine protein kinase